jgi:lathosterol oxidase
MHHEKAGGNFGFYFTWWDKWMGTEHSNYEERFLQNTSRRVKSVNSELAIHRV